jgi:hypothetical protein
MALKRRTRKPLSLMDLRSSISTAVLELERIYMNTDNDTDQRIRAINSLSSIANSYAKLTEISDLEERLTALESQTHLKRVI